VTADLDIWVNPDENNYNKLKEAFLVFRMPVFDMTLKNFLDTKKWDVFRFGRKPVAKDIMTKIKGLEFGQSFYAASLVNVDEIQIRLIHCDHLLTSRKQAGRAKDINDLENLK
jgi:hypothetical protein